MHNTRDDKRAVYQLTHMGNGVNLEGSIGKGNGQTLDVGLLGTHSLQNLILLFEIYARERAYEDEREDNSHNTHRIGHGITHRYILIGNARHIAIGLLCSTQSRSVGHSSRHTAYHRGKRCTRCKMYRIGSQSTQSHHTNGTGQKTQTALLEG